MTGKLRALAVCGAAATFIVPSHALAQGDASRANLWAGSPEVRAGATSLELTVRLGRPGLVHYGVYPASEKAPTAVQLRDNSEAGWGTAILRGHREVTAAGAGAADTFAIAPLIPDSSYRVFLTATPSDSGPVPPDLDTVQVLLATMAERQAASSFRSVATGSAIGYYVYLPEPYRLHPGTAFPLLIFLHGDGERGNGGSELAKVLKWGPPNLIQKGRDLPMIVVTPQLPASYKEWPLVLIDEIIATVRATFSVDSSRTYLTGLSTGADAAWAYAMRKPSAIAAIVPIAGTGDPAKICAMRDVPVWAFHGELDKDEKPKREVHLVDALNACTPPPRQPARLTLYPSGGHEVWTRTYDGRAGNDIYGWMLSNSK